MKFVFVSRWDDPAGTAALGILAELGYATRCTSLREEAARLGEVALFSALSPEEALECMGTSYTLVSVPRIRRWHLAPAWAQRTPFQVVLQGAPPLRLTPGEHLKRFATALIELARRYQEWQPLTEIAPWDVPAFETERLRCPKAYVHWRHDALMAIPVCHRPEPSLGAFISGLAAVPVGGR